jgi:hypothetical protein
LCPFALPFCLWVGSLDLEKVATVFPAMIRGRKAKINPSNQVSHLDNRIKFLTEEQVAKW